MSISTVDLHIHTTASDGGTSPLDIIYEVEKAGLKTISMTDHESIAGFDCLNGQLNGKELKIIPGVELVTWYKGREIHLLGYLFNAEDSSFRRRLDELRAGRNAVHIQMGDNMKRLGFCIDERKLVDIADKGTALGKNHIIKLLVDAGYIRNKEQAFDILRRYLTHNGLAYVDFMMNPFFEAVETIRNSGGIPVLAHPGLIGDDGLVLELVKDHKIGLEVYYHYFGPRRQELISKYEVMARELGLLATGGSDYHGIYSPDIQLGSIMVPEQVVLELEAYHQTNC